MEKLAKSFIYTGLTIFISDFIMHLFLNDVLSNLVTVILAIVVFNLTSFSFERKELEEDINEIISSIYG